MTLQLQSLSISRDTWREKRPLRGTIKFEGINGEVTLILDEERSRALLAVVADLVVASAQEVAQTLVREVLEKPAIEHQPA